MLAPCCVKPSVVVLVPLLALVGVSPSYAPTALRAAIGAMYSNPKKPVVVVRVNVVGSYATVLTNGGRIEGGLVASPILVEHFTFGWQPLALWKSRCDLEEPVLRKSVEEQLMRGMPALRDDRPCHTSFLKDAGPRSEVEAVRKLIPGPLVPYVVVYSSWATVSYTHLDVYKRQAFIGAHDTMHRRPWRPACDPRVIKTHRRKDCDNRRAGHSRDVHRSRIGSNERNGGGDCAFPGWEIVEIADGDSRRAFH